jgi:predicted Abi (CAAX) family protease
VLNLILLKWKVMFPVQGHQLINASTNTGKYLRCHQVGGSTSNIWIFAIMELVLPSIKSLSEVACPRL